MIINRLSFLLASYFYFFIYLTYKKEPFSCSFSTAFLCSPATIVKSGVLGYSSKKNYTHKYGFYLVLMQITATVDFFFKAIECLMFQYVYIYANIY